ncbi:MAG: septum formation initiator family protein [Sebaldella sp.]|nr:septum formation initiator family protein [Sebaldella sp.]
MIKRKNVFKAFFNIVFLFIVLNILKDGVQLNFTRIKLRKQVSDAQVKITDLDKKRKNLEDEIKRIEENEKIERLARDRLDLHKKGETVYKVIE